MDVDIYSLVH